MDGLTVHEEPENSFPTMIVAFAGWPDASESATTAVRFMVRKLSAKKFAEIDPEEFYDFTTTRPRVRLEENGDREITWPGNDFYYHSDEDASKGLILFIGTEPNLKWRTFSEIMLDVADRCGVRMVASLGALNDAVPHTRAPKVSGRASSPELTQKVEGLGVSNSKYEGPTGIHTAFMEASIEAGLEHASLWGHCPHYLTTSPNPKVSESLLNRLGSLIELDVELEELRAAGEAFDAEVTKAIKSQSDITKYVRALEQDYDAAHASSGEIPSPEAMVQELEDFLKSQSQGPSEGQNS